MIPEVRVDYNLSPPLGPKPIRAPYLISQANFVPVTNSHSWKELIFSNTQNQAASLAEQYLWP